MFQNLTKMLKYILYIILIINIIYSILNVIFQWNIYIVTEVKTAICIATNIALIIVSGYREDLSYLEIIQAMSPGNIKKNLENKLIDRKEIDLLIEKTKITISFILYMMSLWFLVFNSIISYILYYRYINDLVILSIFNIIVDILNPLSSCIILFLMFETGNE